MNINFIYDTLHHLAHVFNIWWLIMAWGTGFWSVLAVNPYMARQGLHKEAAIAFFGGWFWLVLGLLGFVASEIFMRYL